MSWDIADHWRDIATCDDDRAAALVRDDRIDILVDLAGHIAGNRLGLFARRPAPIQVTYIGYQNTTGMSALDYRLTDAWSDPPSTADAFYRGPYAGGTVFFLLRDDRLRLPVPAGPRTWKRRAASSSSQSKIADSASRCSAESATARDWYSIARHCGASAARVYHDSCALHSRIRVVGLGS